MNNNTNKILHKITPEIKKDMESIWFTADLHHGHPKIINIHNRPVFLTPAQLLDIPKDQQNIENEVYKYLISEAHDEWIINEVINKYVKRKDTLFLLGDVSMANRIKAEKFLDRLNGNKFLIIGNHDKNIQNSTRFKQTILRKNFNYSKFGLNIHIVLDHFPLASWDRRGFGSWHLYGHVHGKFQNEGLSFDIGIDAKRRHRPLNLFEIITLMELKMN